MSATLVAPVRRVHARDWTGQKSITLSSKLAPDATVGELAETLRQRMNLPRGSYSVYHQNNKLSRSATLDEAGLPEEVELELSPEVKAG